ncbi:MAG TPA: 2-amino-4-hydroxy-6-hydroxymethyldihydropteridine diphosphokinase [Gaiellaceae bacterium]
MTRAYVGLGANLGDREGMLRLALEKLAAEPSIELVAASTLRETEPEDFLDQPRFLNGAAAVETDLSPRQLLARLQLIECELGRRRAGPRFGPRVIDLDLLLYGSLAMSEAELEIPHPRLHLRRFALEPLIELDPELEIPGRGPASTLLAGLD